MLLCTQSLAQQASLAFVGTSAEIVAIPDCLGFDAAVLQHCWLCLHTRTVLVLHVQMLTSTAILLMAMLAHTAVRAVLEAFISATCTWGQSCSGHKCAMHAICGIFIATTPAYRDRTVAVHSEHPAYVTPRVAALALGR